MKVQKRYALRDIRYLDRGYLFFIIYICCGQSQSIGGYK